MREKILIAEDDAAMRELLQEVLEDAGYETAAVVDGSGALNHIARAEEMIDLLVTDMRMPGMTGDELLSVMRAQRPEAPVIIITAFGAVEQAVSLVKAGAFQYLTKPLQTEDLLLTVEEALTASAAQREQARLQRERDTPAHIVGASQPMRELFEKIELAARSESTVLIIGESGTGKELVGRAIHEMSGRKGQFVPINCAAIPAELLEAELFGHTGSAFTGAKRPRAGLFETARDGILFLDEISDMSLAVQPKLLRALQERKIRPVGADYEREVNVRVVAATNRDLEEETRAGRFREDLFWRLNVIRLRVPPLRQRPSDIPLLAEHFVAKVTNASGRQALEITPEALALLTAYSWPGNVRELENAIHRAVAFARGLQITPKDLPERVRASGGAASLIGRGRQQRLTLRELEREYILETLRETAGNKTRAAELLGMDRKTLYRKLDEYRADDPTIDF